MANDSLNGSEILLKALGDQGVTEIFGYPGGAVVPIYEALFGQNALRHILVRQEAGAVHAAEGYARSTGRTSTARTPSSSARTISGLISISCNQGRWSR